MFTAVAPQRLPAFVEVTPWLPPQVACVAKPGRACLAGLLVLSHEAQQLWRQREGQAPFPFASLRIKPHRYVADNGEPPHDGGEDDDDDVVPIDGGYTCACDEVYVGSDGRFELQLLPGLYDVHARDANNAFTGMLTQFEAKEGASVGPVELSLRVALHLTGVVRNAQGQPLPNIRIEVQRTDTGDVHPQSIHGRTNEDGLFDLSPLEDGLYDLEFKSSRHRPTQLFAVSPKRGPFDVRMTRGPALLGMVATSDEDCPPFVHVQGRLRSIRVDTERPGCTFATQVLPPEAQLHVVATVAGRLVEQYFTVPAVGDPPVLCLGGPCAYEPAVVMVMPVGGEMDALFVNTEGTTDDEELGQGMVTSGGFAPNRFYAFSAFRAGQTVRVGDPDQPQAQARLTLHAGVNELVITAPPPRAETPAQTTLNDH